MQGSGGSFFGRRKGKTLRALQRGALDTALPGLLLDLTEPSPDPLGGLFPEPVDDIRLEIGFGGGERLLYEARTHLRSGFIGVEPFRNGLAKTVGAIDREGLRNIRLFDEDAVRVLDWLPAQSLARIDLLYPDPWPKPRHWKRRFIDDANLTRIARCLGPGGCFRFASDVEAYVKWTIRETAANGRLVWVEGSLEASRAAWPDWPGTRYETKAIVEGRRPAYLTFRKRTEA